ncbi:hypothetical protein GCM10023189_43110 [Nibrella saemangeumensis]|uniref:Phage portal protein n=1 Tax=Nibrella saemangeumensis TaxID=1084526 RepID=A0ABP8NAP1_9BACT
MLSFELDILPYLKVGANGGQPSGPLLHEYYKCAVDHAAEIEEVFSTKYPKFLDVNRPKEQKQYKDYRREIFVNPFVGFINRVTSVFGYIRQADDFDVKFPSSELPDEDKLETYCGKGFSEDGSVMDWFFANAIPGYVRDPNAVLLTLPDAPSYDENEYVKPRLHLIPAGNVWLFQKGKKAVLLSTEKSWIQVGQEMKQEGSIIFFIDHESYCIARQTSDTPAGTVLPGRDPTAGWQILGLAYEPFDTVDADGNPVTELAQVFRPPLHYCNGLPARKLGLKRRARNAKKEEWYESLLSDAIPFIKLALQDQNDIQVEKNFHVSSQEWRRSTNKCKQKGCVGGVVYKQATIEGVEVITDTEECPVCKGTGFDVSGSGVGIIWVTGQENMGFMNGDTGKIPPGAPGGFIPRNIESLQELCKQFKENTNEAYATINMQFIRQTPLEVSGTSKRYDREELYRELNTQAAHVLSLLRFAYECIDAQRYGASGRDGVMVPDVMVPVRFNLENAELTREELNNAKERGYDPTLVEVFETKMLMYTVGEKTPEFLRYKLRKLLDPYKDMTDETKAFYMSMLFRDPQSSQQKKALERFWLSIHFDGLVSDALIDDEGFFELPLKQQREELYRRVRELMGPYTTGMAVSGAGQQGFPQLETMTMRPAVDAQNIDQIEQETK